MNTLRRCLVALACAFSGLHAADLYVATDGRDTWSGRHPAANAARSDGPFATLERARDEIRRRRAAGEPAQPFTVHVRAGRYTLAQTFQLEARDSGTAAAPVVWRGYQDEHPLLLGGKPIGQFTVHEGKILKADVGAQGFKGVYFRMLLCDGQQQILARYPNYDPQNPYGGGFAYVPGQYIEMYKDVPGEDKRTFHYAEADERKWANPTEAEVMIFPRYNWWNNLVRIAALDRATRTITLAGDCSYPIRPADRYYVRNVREELDAPGEWYLDRATSTLYFWPPAGANLQTVFAPALRTLVQLGPRTAHVTFRGFIFEGCEGTAITFKDTTDCRLVAATVRNVGDYHGGGIAIDGGTGNGVIGCDFHHIGATAISLSGGEQKTLTPAGNFADNNYIHHTGLLYKQGVGISLRGVGQRAAHNLIHDCPRFAIQFMGNNHLVELNHVRHVNLETADTGAIYTGGRDWLGSRGCIIRYNWFHDMLGFGYEKGKWVSPHFAWGIYLDDNTGGVTVFGNIVARAVRGLIHLHNGRDNTVENNIFVDGTQQQIQLSGWTDQHRYWVTHSPAMFKAYDSVIDQPVWRAMPHMELNPRNAVLPDHTLMAGNTFSKNIIYWTNPATAYVAARSFSFAHNAIDRNLLWHAGQPIRTGQKKAGMDEWAAWQATGMDRTSVIDDPKFVDPAHDNYRLRPDSPAFALGFQPIPVDQIGPQASPDRASWPIIEAEGAREHPPVNH
ncbi:MAG: right-handed parallel beta-helix repeat-containing protein [Verrucomicrobia bacterium]|nr:right-handed parallel beta-helix repeat-containing protein [Verrucomicrobiota bacterium]